MSAYYSELAGFLTESEDGYLFKYDEHYLNGSVVKLVNLTLPLQDKPFVSKTLFPFFDEGWLLEIAQKNCRLTTLVI